MPVSTAKKEEKSRFSLYTYDISKLNKSKRVRFVYALKGRAEEQGLVKHYKGKFLAPACFIIPKKFEKEVEDIFNTWGVKNKKISIIITD